MSTYSASYNYPPEFLWGIIPKEDLISDKDSFSFIFSAQEHHITAIRINVSWAKCEPLNENFDENYIESIRLLLSRIRGRNIEPIVILNTREMPGWKNLSQSPKNDQTDVNGFLAHIIDALIPYSNYFGLICPEGALFGRSELNAKLETISEVTRRIHSLSTNARSVLILPQGIAKGMQILERLRFGFLKKTEVDLFGISTEESHLRLLRNVFGEERKPLMIISDGLKDAPAGEKSAVLADKLHQTWQLYQQGWPVLAYLSETDLGTEDDSAQLYTNTCRKNAFEISTDMDYLPDKWIRFLKD